MRKAVFFLLMWSVILYVCILPVSAHPGGTDWQGGHLNHSTGEYHYHHGYSAHDHYDMDGDGVTDCPYDFDDKSGGGYESSGTGTYSNGYSKGYDDGLSDGYDDGYDIGYDQGKEAGHSIGYREGQKDMQAEMEAKIDSERKDASASAYIISFFIGAPIVAYISAHLAALDGDKREKALMDQVDKLSEELKDIKKATNHNRSVSPTPQSSIVQTTFLPEQSRDSTAARTVYISKGGKKYHCKYRCSNATRAVNLDDLPSTFEPCHNCVPRHMVRKKS